MKYFEIKPQDMRDTGIIHNVLSRMKCAEHVDGLVYRTVGFHADDIKATFRLHGVIVSVKRIDDEVEQLLLYKKGFKLI